MDTRYNVYFAGQVQEGQDPGTVRANLAKLFKADEQTLDKLFSGKIQLLKRECDEDLARKYEQSMQRAGAVAIIRPVGQAAETPPAQKARPQTAAEKIAALAAAPDNTRYQAAAAPTERPGAQAAAGSGESATDEGGMQLAPAGADVLREDERPAAPAARIDTSSFSVDETAERLSEVPPPPPAAPDTSHLEVGEAGAAIPNLANDREPLNPDISHIQLSAPGTDFSDCAGPDPDAPDLDLSALDLAPQGSDVLEEKYRRRDEGAAPATDHLSLED